MPFTSSKVNQISKKDSLFLSKKRHLKNRTAHHNHNLILTVPNTPGKITEIGKCDLSFFHQTPLTICVQFAERYLSLLVVHHKEFICLNAFTFFVTLQPCHYGLLPLLLGIMQLANRSVCKGYPRSVRNIFKWSIIYVIKKSQWIAFMPINYNQISLLHRSIWLMSNVIRCLAF